MAESVIKSIVERTRRNLSMYGEHVVSWSLTDPSMPLPQHKEFIEIHTMDETDAFGIFMIESCIRTLVKAGVMQPDGERQAIPQALKHSNPLALSDAQRRTT